MVSRSTLRRVTEVVAEALLPQRCIVCATASGRPCTSTASRHSRWPVRRVAASAGHRRRDARQCARRAEDAPAYAHQRTLFRFTAETRRALLEAKFRGVIRLIEPLAGTAARAVPLHWRIDVVVPVPPDRSLLRRVRETPPQTALSASRQATNLRGAFAVVGAPPERVLLVDNVTTTESTFDEAAGALLRARAATVYALAIGCED